MLINRDIPTDRWIRLNVNSVDVIAIKVEISKHMLRIFNVYNDYKHSRSLMALDHFLNSKEGRAT